MIKSTALYRLLIIAAILIVSCQDKKAKEPILEENITQSTNPTFIHLSDVHLNASVAKCDYGSDTGTELWGITLEKLSEVLTTAPKPEFVVYTGDLPAHYSCLDTCYLPPNTPGRAEHVKNLKTILNDMRALVEESNTPFFYMPGNNDAIGGDYYSFTDKQGNSPLSLVDTTGITDLYPALNTAVSCGNPPCILSSPNPTMGYYSVKATEGLRILALNSIILGRKYFPLDGVSQLDAGNQQIDWINQELESAKAANDKVYIAMHIPPGEDAYGVTHFGKMNMWAHLPNKKDEWQDQFLTLCAKYSTTISGILYGHTHMDELRRLYANDGTTITEVAIAAPGITPQHHNNPGFKVVSYDPNSFELTDFITHYTTPQATTWGEKTYQFSDKYDCGEHQTIFDCLVSKSLEDVASSMDLVYTVMNGDTTYNPISGIDVKYGQ